MTVAGILGAIAALGTIVGGIVYLVKTGVWAFKKPLETKLEEADADSRKEEEYFEKNGRPKG